MSLGRTVVTSPFIDGPSGEAPVAAVIKALGTPHTPPILCVDPEQAETIIFAVEISLMGLIQLNLSGIAAVR